MHSIQDRLQQRYRVRSVYKNLKQQSRTDESVKGTAEYLNAKQSAKQYGKTRDIRKDKVKLEQAVWKQNKAQKAYNKLRDLPYDKVSALSPRAKKTVNALLAVTGGVATIAITAAVVASGQATLVSLIPKLVKTTIHSNGGTLVSYSWAR